MSQDQEEDVKPKLNLVINNDGHRGFRRALALPLLIMHTTEITVKVKSNMPFRKIFEAAEVRDILSRVGSTRPDSAAETLWERRRQVPYLDSRRRVHHFVQVHSGLCTRGKD